MLIGPDKKLVSGNIAELEAPYSVAPLFDVIGAHNTGGDDTATAENWSRLIAESKSHGNGEASGTVHLLTSERDRNFHVAAADGRAFVLKVGKAADDISISDFQTRALRWITRRAPTMPVPAVQPSLGADLQVVARIRAGSRHVVRVLSFLSGTPLHRTAPSVRQTRDLGRCLAEIGMALDGSAHPATAQDLIWDLQRADRLRPHLKDIADAGLHRLAEAGLDLVEHEVQPWMSEFRRQVVHNDFSPHDVFMDPVDATHMGSATLPRLGRLPAPPRWV